MIYDISDVSIDDIADLGSSVLRVSVVLKEGIEVPCYESDGASGLDLRTPVAFELKSLERRVVWTGIHVAIPIGYEAQIRPRSGLAAKKGIGLLNAPGTIDSDYRGEIGVIMVNLSNEVVQIESGERIAQMVICPVERVELVPVVSLEDSERGAGGFGSTGHK